MLAAGAPLILIVQSLGHQPSFDKCELLEKAAKKNGL